MTPVAKTTISATASTVTPKPVNATKPTTAGPSEPVSNEKASSSQLTLDIPQPESDPELPQESTLLRGVKHFLGDLFSGQN